MKKIYTILLFLMIFSTIGLSQTDAIIGGAGINLINGDPNKIPSLATSDPDEAKIVVNPNSKIWEYNASKQIGMRWNVVDWRYKDSISSFQNFHGFRNSLMGSNNICTVLMLGDSRVEQKTVSESLRRKMRKQYGNAGIGFVVPNDYYPDGVRTTTAATLNNYTALDQSGDALYSFYGKASLISLAQSTSFGPMAIETTKDSLGETRYIDIYYLIKTSGGGLNVKVRNGDNGTATANQILQQVNISTTAGTFANNTVQKTTIDLGSIVQNIIVQFTCTSGAVTVLPTNFRRGTAGLLFHSCGNGSSKVAEFDTWNTNVGAYFAGQIKPNLFIFLGGVNDITNGTLTEREPNAIKTAINNLITRYAIGTGIDKFSSIVIGETGTRITEQNEDAVNSAFYNLALQNFTYTTFVNFKDIAPDWTYMASVPGFAFLLNDNVHWGIRGGNIAADYLYHKIRFNSREQTSLFPRTHYKIGLNSTTYTATNVPNLGSQLYAGEIGQYITFNKVQVIANGIERIYNAGNTALGWNYSGDTITVYDALGVAEVIKTIKIQILQ